MEKTYTQLITENQYLQEEVAALRLRCAQNEHSLRQQLKVDEQLRDSQERFRTIFHQSNVAHKVIDRSLKIVEINQAVADLLGYTIEEILGTKILDYTHPDFKVYWQDLQVALWEEQVDQFQLEACLIRKNGSEAWVIVHTILFKDQGASFGYTLLEDITSRKQLERHKDDFISVISHELKTPMTSLKAQCQLIARHLKKYEDGHADQMMSGIEKQTNRLTRLIQNLVLVSKIESSKLQPDVQDYCLDELVQEVVSEFELSSSGRTFTLDLESALSLKGDPDKIYQVMYNLLGNALKFSEKNTDINITIKRQQQWAVVCIQDHGKGIPRESLEKVFERFYKVETASSAIEAGVGLGLYISSEIISHQNGKLWIKSETDKGSTFCFSLPLLNL